MYQPILLLTLVHKKSPFNMKSKQSLSIVGLVMTTKHAAATRHNTNPITTSNTNTNTNTNNDYKKSCPPFGINLDEHESALGRRVKVKVKVKDKESPAAAFLIRVRGGAQSEDDHIKDHTTRSSSTNNSSSRTSSSGSSSGRKKKKKKKSKQSGATSTNDATSSDEKVNTNLNATNINNINAEEDVETNKTTRTSTKPGASTSSEEPIKNTDHQSQSHSNVQQSNKQSLPKTQVPPPPPPSNDQTNRKTQPSQTKPKPPLPKDPTPTPPKRDPKDDAMEQIIQSTDLYQILSLDKSQKASLTSTQITKAYRRRAVLTHPDKCNGDRRAFDKVSEAYDVLSDEQKKKIYDIYGLEAVKDPDFAARTSSSMGMNMNMSSGGSFQDQILKSFFGATSRTSSSFSRMSQQFRKNHDLKYELEVSLQDIYKGAHREVQISQPGGPKMVDLDIPAGVVPGSSIRLSGMVDHVSTATPGDVVFIIREKRHEMFTRKGHDLAVEMKISLSEAICGFERQIVHLDGRRVSVTGPIAVSIIAVPDGNDTNTDTDTDTNTNMNMNMNVHSTPTPQTIETPTVIQTGDVHVLKGEGMPKANMRSHHHHHMDDHHHHHHNEKERCEKYGDLYVQYVVEMPSTNPENLQKLSKEERQMLGILLDKIHHTPRTTLSKGQGQEDEQSEGETYSSKPYRLVKSRVADFGKASGIAIPERDEEDDHMHNGGMEEQPQHPFGSSRGFQTFSSCSRSQFFSRGSSPFTSSPSYGGEEEGGDVQCQQM